ncbi:MAG: AAA family ATPase [Clostridia bacterium]|nr:AAA family ATPase [Clostridia bacterium]
MIINKLKINGFGKLENKEIELNDKINIIKGDNESGKSTLLKFISSSLYGISRNKNGKDISDYDKYIPWNADEFSGKITYHVDNGDKYEIYNDFRKKSPQIYKNKEDVSDKFKITKSKGSEFFIEQTGITEDMFFSTCLSEQGKVELDKNSQNTVMQKLSNIISTGNENISYKKTIEKINKKQLQEIGTDRSSGRPINIVNSKIEELENKIKQIEIYKDKKYEIEEEKNNLAVDINESKIELEILRKIKIIKEKNLINNEKLNILDNEIDGYSEMQENKKKEINNLKVEKQSKRKSNKIIYAILILLIILITIMSFIMNKPLILIINALIISVLCILFLKDKKTKIVNKRYKENLTKINENIERLEEIKKLKMIEIDKLEKEIQENETLENEKIKKEFLHKISKEKIEDILSTKYEKIVDKINEKEAQISEYSVSEKKIEVSNEDVNKNLENLVCLEEELDKLYEEKEELINKNNIYNLVKQNLEEAYKEMQSNITPEFIIEIQNIISKSTNNKYNKCIVDEDGIKIEVENGSYMNVNRLSQGTIDLIYLALRISAARSMSDELIPIILDESFAYYDKNRMKNIIKYLNEKCNNQIIIFTCTSRECEAIEEEKIEYNLVNL